MAPVPGRALLSRVIARVYERGQSAGSRLEYELATITIRFLAQLRRGDPASLDYACQEAAGTLRPGARATWKGNRG